MEALAADDPERIGRYRLIARLGAGGMGRVYLAESPGRRLVALKTVHEELARQAEFRARFAREVAAMRRVGGFWTAAVVDADTASERPWLATDYVAGPSLAAAVAATGALPAAALPALAAGLAEALEAIHGAGLVHRDLKPANVLMAPDGPRVIDFGIARVLDGSAITGNRGYLGTPGFMSPERLLGEEVHAADDVFCFGLTVAFAATARNPFGDGDLDALGYRIVQREPDLEGVPAELRPLIAACLAKDPERRPGAGQIVALLAAMSEAEMSEVEAKAQAEAVAGAEAESTPAPAPVPPPAAVPPDATTDPASPRRRRVLTSGAALVGVALVGTLGYESWPGSRTPKAAPPSTTRPPSTPGAASSSPAGPREDTSLSPASVSYVTGPNALFAFAARTGDPPDAWKPPPLAGSLSLPTRYQDLILVAASHLDLGGNASKNSRGTLFALNRVTGARQWSTAFTGSVDKIAAADGVVCVNAWVADDNAGSTTNAYAFDASSGGQLWAKQLPGVPSPPLIAGGLAYVGVGDDSGSSKPGLVYAFDLRTGTGRWTSDGFSDTELAPMLRLALPNLLVEAIGQSGASTLYCYDAGSGTRKWKLPLPDDPSVVVSDGMLHLAGTKKGPNSPPNGPGDTVYVSLIDAGAGTVTWTKTFAGSTSGCCVAGTALCVTAFDTKDWNGAGVVAAFDTKSGALLWTSKALKAPSFVTPSVPGAVLVSGSKTLSSLSLADGSVRWQTGADTVPTDHANAGNSVLVATPQNLVSLDAGSGAVRWRGAAIGSPTTGVGFPLVVDDA